MKLVRAAAVAAALLLSAGRAGAQTQTVETGREVKADVGFGVEIQLSTASGRVQRTGYPRVSSVSAGSSAARAGLMVGDLVVAVDGRDTRQGGWFADLAPGKRYTVRVNRGDTEREIVIVAGPPPARR